MELGAALGPAPCISNRFGEVEAQKGRWVPAALAQMVRLELVKDEVGAVIGQQR